MATSPTSAPADSIFAVMSPQSNDPRLDLTTSSFALSASSSASSVVPLLGMLVDRTSFDETDDFGVGDVISDEYVAGPPTVMRDGKVRRRMRWRPKSMVKRRKVPAKLPMPSSSQRRNGDSTLPPLSSNGSVHSSSNASVSSRQSKRSLHSFASTETASINNTKTAIRKPFTARLPRHTSSNPKPFEGVATIGTEGDYVHSKTKPTAGSADVRANQQTTPRSKSKRPPLFQRSPRDPPTTPSSTAATMANSPSSIMTSMSTMSTLDETTPVATHTLSDTHYYYNADDDDNDGSPPVPALSGDEVETDRRLDLCIRRTPSSMSRNRSGGSSVSPEELRATDEERQDQSRPSSSDVSPTASAAVDEAGVTAFNSSTTAANSTTGHATTPSNSTKGRIPSLSAAVSDSFINKFRRLHETSPRSVQESLSTSSSISSKSSEEMTDPTDHLRFSMSTGNIGSPSPQELTLPSDTNTVSSAPVTSAAASTSAMASSNKNRKNSHPDRAFSPRPNTGPVDVDNHTFLEAEKNLQAIHEMASDHLRQGEYPEALEVFEEILRGQLARYGPDHPRVGTALHNIGVVHMRRGDCPRATQVYKEAVRVRKLALDPWHGDVAVSLAQLGVAYMESQKHRKAIGAFREALKIRRHCLGNEHPKVAKILNNIGCSLFELEELEVAKVAFEEALDIQRRLLRSVEVDGPLSQNFLLSIASTQSNIASIKLFDGDYDQACVDLEEALLIQQCVLGDDHPLARRTHESLQWMETSRTEDHDSPVATDLLAQLTRSMSTSSPSTTEWAEVDTQADAPKSLLSSLLTRLDLVCRGCDDKDETTSLRNKPSSAGSSPE